MNANFFTKLAFAASAVALFLVARHYDKLSEEGEDPAKYSQQAELSKITTGEDSSDVSEKRMSSDHSSDSSVQEKAKESQTPVKKAEASAGEVSANSSAREKTDDRKSDAVSAVSSVSSGCSDKLYIRGLSFSKSPNPEDHVLARNNFKASYESGCGEAAVEYAKMLIAGKGGDKDIKSASKILKKAAENGIPGASAVLSSIELSQITETQADKEHALEIAKSSALQGNIGAAGTACSLLLFGEAGRYPDGTKNLKDAAEFCRIGAEGGDAESMKNLGHMYALGFVGNGEKDPATAASWFLKASQKGSMQASIALALQYYNGSGVERNVPAAVKLLEPYAKKGDAESLYFLGKIYLNGGSDFENFQIEGMKFIQQSADSGFMPAMYFMASAYENGTGVDKDSAKALSYYKILADNGDKEGTYAYANMLYKEGNKQEADKWIKTAAEKGHPRSMAKLAIMYKNGDAGLEKDEKKAVEIMTAAAQKGDAMAMTYYAIWTGAGMAGLQKDEKKAFEWFEKAANAGNIYSMYRTGYSYRKAIGIEKDYAKAMFWLQKAAANGNAKAMTQLGIMHYDGQGTQRSAERSREWLIKADAAGDPEAPKLLKWMSEQQASETNGINENR